jgi:hypothetical protein
VAFYTSSLGPSFGEASDGIGLPSYRSSFAISMVVTVPLFVSTAGPRWSYSDELRRRRRYAEVRVWPRRLHVI